MKIKITEPYLWLPVDAKEEKVLLHLYVDERKSMKLRSALVLRTAIIMHTKMYRRIKIKNWRSSGMMREIWIGSFSIRRNRRQSIRSGRSCIFTWQQAGATIRVGWSMRMVSTICTISAILTDRNGKTCTGDMPSVPI